MLEYLFDCLWQSSCLKLDLFTYAHSPWESDQFSLCISQSITNSCGRIVEKREREEHTRATIESTLKWKGIFISSLFAMIGRVRSANELRNLVRNLIYYCSIRIWWQMHRSIFAFRSTAEWWIMKKRKVISDHNIGEFLTHIRSANQKNLSIKHVLPFDDERLNLVSGTLIR